MNKPDFLEKRELIMNEYRFNGGGIPEMRKNTKNSGNSIASKRMLAASVCILTAGVVMLILSLVLLANANKTNNNAAGNIQTEDTRGKSDIGSMISSGIENALSVSKIYEIISPSVVGITTKVPVASFFGQSIGEGSGSGVIISSDGYIMTNNHVIADAQEINVVLSDERKYSAVIVGNDERTDLAVIKINEENLPAALLGDSDTVKPGELAVAIGNPLGQELAGSITAGVVSAVNRNINVQGKQMNLIQTDAAINPGNSGGALVNCFGEVIGINTVKMSSTSVEGIGFAIPISEAMPIVNSLVDNGRVVGRTYIGIKGENAPYGVIVRSVDANSPASKAGIGENDLIVKVNDTTVTSVQEINNIKEKLKVGDTIVLTIYKNGELVDINVVLEESLQ